MNEYTRREEVRWTFVASLCLVLFLAPAVILLVTAKGKLIQDPKAAETATAAEERATAAQTCTNSAAHLATEIDVFKSQAKAAHLDAPIEEAPPPEKKKFQKKGAKPPPKEKPPDASIAWPAAQPTHKLAKALTGCQVTSEANGGESAAAKPAWEAVAKAAAIPSPGADKTQQVEAAKALLKLVEDAPVDKVIAQTKAAAVALDGEAKQARAVADKATINAPLPEGLFPRRVALGVGIALSVIALLISYISVRFASQKRLEILGPLRERERTTKPGLHAAAILRLATMHSGGEPGLVVGGALGGLLAAWAVPIDADFFIFGVMGGLVFGIGLQWAMRTGCGLPVYATRTSEWRKRATELAEVEKPTIPMLLVLSGVKLGLEAEFIKFFNGLAPEDAAITVEKLAAQAEEQILVAADAGAQMAAAQPYPGGMPPGGMPPGGMMPPQGR